MPVGPTDLITNTLAYNGIENTHILIVQQVTMGDNIIIGLLIILIFTQMTNGFLLARKRQ